MPHVIIKLYPGRSEQQKMQLTEEIVKDIVTIAQCKEKSVSVAIEEIKPEEWAEKVYKPDIMNNQQRLYKKPEYNPFDQTKTIKQSVRHRNGKKDKKPSEEQLKFAKSLKIPEPEKYTMRELSKMISKKLEGNHDE